MCLNHPELVHKHPAHLYFPCNDVDREGSVQSNHPELMTKLYTPCYLCNDVVRERFNEVRVALTTPN